MLRYCRSSSCGYIRILELEGVTKRALTSALDTISRDFSDLDAFIIDIRNCPGGEDSTAISIINRFCDRRRVGFRRQTKIGPGENDFTPLKAWHIEPHGDAQFNGPIALLTCDLVFSGGEAFALAIRQLPHSPSLANTPMEYFHINLRRSCRTAGDTPCHTRSTCQQIRCATKARGCPSTSSY